MSTKGFLLGHIVDPASGERSGADVDLDPADLTTHGVIVGMTGSGKTGLGVILLEEALRTGLPTLVIDPKGDMGALKLLFPEFRADDFEPWVSADEARRAGVTTAELGEKAAALWKKGVSGWDPSLEAIRTLKDAVDVTIYTPGSSAGVPINVIGSLAAPKLDWTRDAETGRDEIEGLVSSLLTLAGVAADPLSSPEHILLATIIEQFWSAGRDLDMATLIGAVQQPPMRKLGVFEVDMFFPPKDRMALAMRLNGLIASPAFAAWAEGPPLDIPSMLFEPDGRPRAAIIYLAHLSEEERQFIVTMILSKVVTWMRGLSGATDLRALVYMDEVFGYAPPTANPPSKKPILTMLKQARAYGVGLTLSTQNPVDLDYKAMSNTGAWMIGRLQTERDKARILEALQSAGGGRDIKAIDRMISGLGKRQFLLHNTHEPEPSVFTTRWAMSYLRGPLTRDEVKRLTPEAAATAPPQSAQPAQPTEAAAPVQPQAPQNAAPALAEDETPVPPKVSARADVRYLDPAAPWAAAIDANPAGLRLEPYIAARVHLVYDETKADLRHEQELEMVFRLTDAFDPAEAICVDYDPRDFQTDPPERAVYTLIDAPIHTVQFWSGAGRKLKDHLYRRSTVTIFHNPPLKLYSRVDESEAAFQARCDRAAEDRADQDIAKLRDRLDKKLDRARDQLAAAERRVRELESETRSRAREEWFGGAGDVLGTLLGRRRSRTIEGAVRRSNQTERARRRLRSAEEKAQERVARIEDLELDLAREIEAIDDKWEDASAEITTLEVGLEKNDISVAELALVWVRK